jgi:hypothetical protein
MKVSLRELRELIKSVIREDDSSLSKLSGGLADDSKLTDFDPEELLLGMREEGDEHTSDKNKALEIAMDHLTTDPKYYSKRTDESRLVEYQVDSDGPDTEHVPREITGKTHQKSAQPTPTRIRQLFNTWDGGETLGVSRTGGIRDVTGPALEEAGKTAEGRYEIYSFEEVIDTLLKFEKIEYGQREGRLPPKDVEKKMRHKISLSLVPSLKELVEEVNSVFGDKSKGVAKAIVHKKANPAILVNYFI